MADLVVDTHALRVAAGELVGLSHAAHELADGHVRAAQLAPACGLDDAAQAVDAFLNTWAYGIRWIASQAEQLGRDLRTSADTFAVIEARLAQDAGGAAFAPVLSAPPATMVEAPLPMVRHWTGVLAPPMQLAHATRADQLIPGDPDQVRQLGRLVASFADAAYEARSRLGRSSLGGWTGAAAQAVEAELTQLMQHLVKAEEAFSEAAGALSGFVPVHADSQAAAARAIELWQSAIVASQVARGAVVGAAPVGAPADPDAVLARAGALAQDAIEQFRMAGRTLAEVLHQAKEGAPKDPGFWAHVRRAVASFGLGLSESVFGIAEGAVMVGKLAVNLNPVRAIYDPDGYVAAQEALYVGLGHALLHPEKVGAALLNWDELTKDPARWAGEMLPDLLAIGAAGHALGAARKAESLEQVGSAAGLVETAERKPGGFRFSRLSAEDARQKLVELRLDPDSAVGDATRHQLDGAFGRADKWAPTHLVEGQRIAILDGGRAIVPFDGSLPTDTRKFFEQIQMYGRRSLLSDGTVGAPEVGGHVVVYEVKGAGGIDAARALAEANTQFGAGGGTRLFVKDIDDAFANNRLVAVPDHEFDLANMRTPFEDPRYRAFDPTMPIHALDPKHERIVGFFEGLREKATETVRDTAIRTGETAAVGATDRSDR